MSKKKLLNKIFLNKFSFFLIGLVILIALSLPLAKKVSKQYKVNQEIIELEKEISELEKKNLELNNLMDYLDSDQFIEEQARLKLNYKKEGENLLVINNREQTDNINDTELGILYSIPSSKVISQKEILNPQKWIHYFFYN